MGSTSHNPHTTWTTPNVANALFERGEYRQAFNEYLLFLGNNWNNRQAKVKAAICQFRDGDRDAIDSLYRDIGRSLTVEDKQLILRHQFIVALINKRPSDAIKLLRGASDGSHGVVLHKAEEVIFHAKKADAGRRYKIQHQPLAEMFAQEMLLAHVSPSSSIAWHIDVLIDYIMIVVEHMREHDSKKERLEAIAQRRQSLTRADTQLERSVPRREMFLRPLQMFKA